MKFHQHALWAFAILLLSAACKNGAEGESFFLDAVYVGNEQLIADGQTVNQIPIDLPFELIFSTAVDPATAEMAITLLQDNATVEIQLQLANGNRNVHVTPRQRLDYNTAYTLAISNELKSQNGAGFMSQDLLFRTVNGSSNLTGFTIDGKASNAFTYLTGVSLQPKVRLTFSLAIDTSSLRNNFDLTGGMSASPQVSFSEDLKEVSIEYTSPLEDWTKYTFQIKDGLQGKNGESIAAFSQEFYTVVDETPKFPMITDEELLTLIQEQTFKYFWDFGHPVSGLARERNTSGETVTFGGSGFGLMAMIVGVERGFITLEQAVERWQQIIRFLETADRFHGAFPHWMDGTTGKVRPFSERDNGADLVETAFFVQGLLSVRQYLRQKAPGETTLINQIDKLWREVEWDWFTQGGDEALYWHWSPDNEWAINLPIRGHNETQIVYILAAASPTHSIGKALYDTGYARSGQMVNGNEFYGIDLPLGSNYGGPLFFAHYSYLGLDPRNLEDQYANYWTQNVNHSRINHAYSADNPKNYVGYSDKCWGLTASDNDNGYSAHSPNNDQGVITPTAAISSIPYTPEESMAAIRHFYYTLGDRLWGPYGFYDAFNPTADWVAGSFLAIDQGPIIIMIENYRTGLLWDLFMSSPEVQNGLTKLGFTY